MSDLDRDPPERDRADHAPPVPPVAVKPRVWPAFVTCGAAMIAAIALQILVAVVAVVALIARGDEPSPERMVEAVQSFPAVIVLIGTSQLVMVGAAIVAAWRGAGTLRTRLGLVAPRIGVGDLLLVVSGSVFVLGVGIGASIPLTLVYTPDQSIHEMRLSLGVLPSILFIVMIGVAPGICEETLFRGYMQPVFVRRWGRRVGIVVASLVFAVFHLDPMHVVLAFPLGVWLGAVAVRTGSIIPGIICHAFVNSAFNLVIIVAGKLGVLEQRAFALAGIGVFAAAGVPFVFAVRRLWRASPT